MNETDWKTVSTHYIRDLIVKAIDTQGIDTWNPTLLVAACEDALAMARILRAELKARGKAACPILTQKLELYDDLSNPYNVHVSAYKGSFSGQKVLLVDKADNSRASIVSFIQNLQQQAFAEQKQAAGADWVEPAVGVFVLHNKRKEKTASLPEGVHEFIGENTDDVHIAYATSGSFSLGEDQPLAHHTHSSGTLKAPGRSSLDPTASRRAATPPLPSTSSDMLRSVSSHYVEHLLEAAVEDQHIVERFGPTMLVAASDGALAPARLLRHYLRFRASAQQHASSERPGSPVLAHDLPVLTPRLELYDEDQNPYLAHIHGTKAWGPASLAGQHVLVVDRADNTRTTLAAFIRQLQEAAAGAKAEAEAQGAVWPGDPVIGVFVLHNKKVEKHADLPPEILADRYFYGEEMESCTVLYPFNVPKQGRATLGSGEVDLPTSHSTRV